MFAHQVIEDVKEFCRKIDYTKTGGNGRLVFDKLLGGNNLIQKAQKFHMGDISDIFDIFKGYYGKQVFTENILQLNLPYKVMWVDATFKESSVAKPANVGYDVMTNTKEAALIVGVTKQIFIINMYSFLKECNSWVPMPFPFAILVGGSTKDNLNEFNKLSGCTHPIGNTGSVIPLFSKDSQEFYGITEKDIITLCNEAKTNLQLAEISIRLLNTKNIEIEKIIAPPALNKKRRLNGKQEIFDYHVLNVVVPSDKKRGYQEKSIPLSHNRVHLCRGHFKEYTTEHPLFGKYTGLYWWQPSVRGQNKDGIVIKDYNIKTA